VKNPCKDCLLIINCTAVCEDKENFQTLLKVAMKQFGFGFKVSCNQDRALFKRWAELKTENELDMVEIRERAASLRAGRSLM